MYHRCTAAALTSAVTVVLPCTAALYCHTQVDSLLPPGLDPVADKALLLEPPEGRWVVGFAAGAMVGFTAGAMVGFTAGAVVGLTAGATL